MTYLYNTKTGKSNSLDELSGVSIIDPRTGEAIQEVSIGRTSRELLGVANSMLANDWGYMPVRTQDIVQSTALDMMTDAGGFALAKIISGVIGGFVSGGNPAGAGLGYMIAEAGLETYQYYQNMKHKDDPNKFWSDFVGNVNNFKQNDDALSRFAGGFNTFASTTGMGAQSALFQEWGDVLGSPGIAYNIAGAMGTLVSNAAFVMATGVAPGIELANPKHVKNVLIGASLLTDASREAAQELGTSGDVLETAKVGAIHAMASGVSSWAFLKGIPSIASAAIPGYATAASKGGIVGAAMNGAEMAGYVNAYWGLAAMGMGQDYEVSWGTTGAMFVLGGLFGAFRSSTVDSPQVMAKQQLLPGYEKPAIIGARQLENKTLTMLPSNIDKMVYDTTDQTFNKRQLNQIAHAVSNRDRALGNFGDGSFTNQERLLNEYMMAKGKFMSQDDAAAVNKYMENMAPELTRTYRQPENLKKLIPLATDISNDAQMSLQAQKVLGESLETLTEFGLVRDKQEMLSLANHIVELAKKNQRGKGSIGNFEIKQAFDNYMEEVYSGFYSAK